MSIFSEEKRVFENILGAIGNTPVVRLNKVGKDLDCELYVKCEFLNAGGSVKDRIGKRMVIEGEKEGKWKKGDTLIEPTSGNTGIGIALAAAVLDYEALITMPKKMSNEKIAVLKALGAKIRRTPTEAAFDDPDSHISLANDLQKQLPNAHIPDQYSNVNNPLAHYEGTAEEIIRQFDGKLDMVVIAAGTGGTITGIAKKLKEKIPNIRVVGVDPYGSILAGPDEPRSYNVEGIGYDFLPEVFDGKLVDDWYKSEDKESFILARRLIKEEGLLVGGSCGSAMAGALKFAKELGAGQRCLVILADSIRNYITKFADDKYMYDFEYYAAPASSAVPDVKVIDIANKEAVTLLPTATVADAVALFKKDANLQFIPLIDEDKIVAGIVSKQTVLSFVLGGGDATSNIKDAEIPVYRKLASDTVANVARFSLEINQGVCIVADKNEAGKFVYKGLLTNNELFSAAF